MGPAVDEIAGRDDRGAGKGHVAKPLGKAFGNIEGSCFGVAGDANVEWKNWDRVPPAARGERRGQREERIERELVAQHSIDVVAYEAGLLRRRPQGRAPKRRVRSVRGCEKPAGHRVERLSPFGRRRRGVLGNAHCRDDDAMDDAQCQDASDAGAIQRAKDGRLERSCVTERRVRERDDGATAHRIDQRVVGSL
ncbi:MAG: hypothetical protein WCQ45_03850 [bacterium]